MAASPKSSSKRSSSSSSKSGTPASKPRTDTAARAAASVAGVPTFAKGKRPSDGLSGTELVAMYRTMVLARRFEEWVITLFQEGSLPGFLHVAIGQEGVAAGVGHALHDDDYIGSTHRAHAHIVARGSDITAMMAEMMGKVTGLCQGKGGSMHLSDMSRNVVGANGVVGSGAPMMTGVALAQKTLDTGRIAVAFYGDGASNQGNVHEAMNLAQLWKLPVLFVLENNRYAESTPYWQQVPVEDLATRGAAYDMTTYSVDGNDVLEVFDTVSVAAEHARTGEGPVYIVAETTRLSGHYVGDAEVYRPKGEAKKLRELDPIVRFRAQCAERGVSEADLKAVDAEVEQTMDDAVEAARAADFPPAEDAMKHVYAEFPYRGPVLGLEA